MTNYKNNILIAGIGKSGTTALFFRILNSLPSKNMRYIFEPRKDLKNNQHE
jgi:hypothetical protein